MSADLNIQQNRFENPNFSVFVKLEGLFLSKQYKNSKIGIRKPFTTSQKVPRHYYEM